MMERNALSSNRNIRVDSPSVLVIDPDPIHLTALAATLDMHGYRAVLARSEAIAKKSIASQNFDVLVLSITSLEEGCAFARRLREAISTQDIPIIFAVPELADDWIPRLATHGGVFCAVQPLDPQVLVELVEKSIWLPHVAASRLASKSNVLPNGSAKPTRLAKSEKTHDWISLD